MMNEYNLNDIIIIYPNESGLDKMIHLYQKNHDLDIDEAKKSIMVYYIRI